MCCNFVYCFIFQICSFNLFITSPCAFWSNLFEHFFRLTGRNWVVCGLLRNRYLVQTHSHLFAARQINQVKSAKKIPLKLVAFGTGDILCKSHNPYDKKMHNTHNVGICEKQIYYILTYKVFIFRNFIKNHYLLTTKKGRILYSLIILTTVFD